MNSCIIVTEGESKGRMLQRLVRSERAQFYGIPGRSAAVSLARSLLAVRPARIGLVLDADAFDPTAVELKRGELLSSLSAAGPRDRFEVFLVVPAVERWLFADERAPCGYFGRDLPQDALLRARFEPRQVLEDLSRLYGRPALLHLPTIASLSDPKKVKDLDPEFARLCDFVEDRAVMGRAI